MAPNRPFVTDPVLTAIAIGYRNPARTLIADEVLPRVQVGAEEFKWMHYPLGEAFTVPDTRVGRTGQVNQVEFNGEERTSSTEDYGLDMPIPQSDIDAARDQRNQGRSSYDPEAHAAARMTDLTMLDREIRVAGMIQDPANYATGRKVVLSGTSQWSDYANSTPIADIKAALEGTLIYRPNTLVFGQASWSALSSHPELVNAIRGNLTDKGIVRREEVAQLFEVSRILVGESYHNIARPGQNPTLARVWGRTMAALYIDAAARPEDGMTFGMTAQYGTRIGARLEDSNIGLKGGVRVRSGEQVKEVITAPDVGFLMQDVVAE